jgi:hypothetical protein
VTALILLKEDRGPGARQEPKVMEIRHKILKAKGKTPQPSKNVIDSEANNRFQKEIGDCESDDTEFPPDPSHE